MISKIYGYTINQIKTEQNQNKPQLNFGLCQIKDATLAKVNPIQEFEFLKQLSLQIQQKVEITLKPLMFKMQDGSEITLGQRSMTMSQSNNPTFVPHEFFPDGDKQAADVTYAHIVRTLNKKYFELTGHELSFLDPRFKRR